MVKTSPLAKKLIFLLYLEPIIIASKKELGWFAIINRGPLVFNKYLFLILISAQKSQSAARKQYFNIVINFFYKYKKTAPLLMRFKLTNPKKQNSIVF